MVALRVPAGPQTEERAPRLAICNCIEICNGPNSQNRLRAHRSERTFTEQKWMAPAYAPD
jgi:hypothetical protein